MRLQVAQIIQANLKDVGIDMKIETLEWGTYLQKTAAKIGRASCRERV